MPDTLVLLTAQFPYGKSETFLESELSYIAKAFKKVYIVTLTKSNSIREVPANVTVLSIGDDFDQHYSSFKSIKYLAPIIFHAFVKEYQNGSGRVDSKGEFISYMLRINYKAFLLEAILKKYNIPADATFYTYWFEEWATILALLKKKQVINTFISRVHGFDLYEERNTNNYIKFRSLQLQEVNKVYAISKAGITYFKARYPQHASKVQLSYLGVHDHGINPDKTVSDVYTIASCSNVVPVKRVALIAEALRFVDVPIKWIHFGDGPLMDSLREACTLLPANVDVELKGRISNSELMQLYKQTHVSLFINVSESEGLPVSIMEAISFGIPILATDVGGTSEIVTDKTGVLVSSDVTPEEIAKQISYAQTEIDNYASTKRKGIRLFWAEHFDAASNYPEFISKLIATS